MWLVFSILDKLVKPEAEREGFILWIVINALVSLVLWITGVYFSNSKEVLKGEENE